MIDSPVARATPESRAAPTMTMSTEAVAMTRFGGNDGDDRIIGGAGDDLLDGRTGIDDCRPGDGANTVLNCEPSGGPRA